jgi:phenylacetate-CoA ligase
MTSIAEERAEQQRWMRLIRRPVPAYDRLLENEFDTLEHHHARLNKVLGAVLRFAAREVPHYLDALRRAAADVAVRDATQLLAAMPVMSKLDVQDAGAKIRSRNMPPGEQRAAWWKSSGTTGRPTLVLHSKRSVRMFSLLAQRSARWHRLDPTGTFADMRIPSLLPRRRDGSEVRPGETVRLPVWRDAADFTTGPFVGVSIMTPVEDRIQWLRRERPDYLMTYPETLELLALSSGDERPVESLKAVIAISEQLTPSMRACVERRFGTPVHQVYGLTEIGLAATRCEAGRYHVNNEHCVVEILDEKGRPCPPGETGRIVITGLSNLAMPLIRYDTGDLAEVAAGPCPCSRTLPVIGEIVGRYGRIAFLPPGTMGPIVALRAAIETMDLDLARNLREFQIHQYIDHRLELRLVVRSPLPDAFFALLRAEWAKVSAPSGPALNILIVDQIAKSGKKAEVFTSDFFPARDGDSVAGPSSSPSGRA